MRSMVRTAMATEYVVASPSTRTYFDLFKGPWFAVYWAESGDVLRASVGGAMLAWYDHWSQEQIDEVASLIVNGVSAMPNDRRLVSEHEDPLWQDIICDEPNLRAFDGHPPKPYTAIGSRFGGVDVTWEWAKLCSRERRYCEHLSRRFAAEHWHVGDPYFDGVEWVAPASMPLTEAAAGPRS